MNKNQDDEVSSSVSSSDEELETFAQRLRIAATGMDAKKVSLACGVEHRSVLGYLAGKTDPSRRRAVQLAKGLGVRLEWLASGEGPMQIGPASSKTDLGMRLSGIPPQERAVAEPAAPYGLPVGFFLVPRYDVRAAAGRGTIVESEDKIGMYAYEEGWLRRELKADPGSLCVIGVVGNSMEDEIYDGDEVLVDRSVTRFIGDGIYLVRLEGGLIIKQLQRLVGGGLRIVSRNPRYESQTINERAGEYGTDFAILGRVLGKPGFVKF
jgi:phage repressor protein C with HTH and peptisase S24 domain